MLLMLKFTLVLLTIVLLLRRKVMLGNAMFAGSIMLIILGSPTAATVTEAVETTIFNKGTWNLLAAMYLVMCLEYQLRTGGILDGMMAAIRRLASDRVLLALMPAFMGFLPSLGGAILSAPMVENASKEYPLSPEQKTAINYWFRHISEFCNPIVPAMLLSSEILQLPMGTLILHFGIFTLLSVAVGWIFWLRGLKKRFQLGAISGADGKYRFLLLAGGPIVANMLLVVLFNVSAAGALAIVVLSLALILKQPLKDMKTMAVYALDKKLLWGVFAIILFQHTLTSTKIVDGLVLYLNSLGISYALMIGVAAFAVGLASGSAQGFVAVVFPLIAALSPGNIGLAAIGFVMGLAGHMLSPAHLCLVVTVQYFKADMLKALRPIVLLEIVMIACAFLYNFIYGTYI